MSKQTLIKIGIGVLVIAVIICVIVFSGNKDGTEKQTEGDGVIIGVGDNNNDNNGDKVTADNGDENDTNNSEEDTTEPPREVIETTNSVAGNWASLRGDVIELIPARGNEAEVYLPNKDIFYKGTYETDDKTYIKINYVDTSDSQHTGVIEFTIISLGKDSDGKIQLMLKDADNIEYIFWPAS